MPKLQNKVAIITGSSRGIGQATAQLFAQEGAKVVLTSPDQLELQDTVQRIIGAGGKALGIPGDVSKSDDVKCTIKETLEEWGKIDILVNNAGIAFRRSLEETTEQDWDRLMTINLKGIFLFSKLALPLLLKTKGVIVNLASVAGKKGWALYSAYCTSKFGVIGLTQSLAEELKELGVRVYAICPGGVDTTLHREVYHYINPQKLLKPQEVAQKILELVATNTKYPTGSIVEIVKK